MIPQDIIDKIMNTANIVDVVSEYVSLRRSGASYKGLCPFHDDTTPSFYVSPARGICKCFSCGEGGNAVHFIMKKEQLTYYEALRFLAKKYNIEFDEKEMTAEEKQIHNERESMFAVNAWASNYFNETLKNSEDGKAIGLAYFYNRGFREDIITKFRLGYSLQQHDALAKTAMKMGYKEEYLIKTGLCYKRDDGTLRDKYWGRVIFPWFGVNGQVIGFGGRVLDARTKGVNQKYINSPESEIYHKANELYGLFQAKQSISKKDNVYMVEGYTDVLSMHQSGIENVVANSGTALSNNQIRLLRRYTKNITLIYDGDSAGIHAALRGTDMLFEGGMRVKILLLPDGEDPDSFARKHNATEFKEYVETHQTDFITFKTNLLKEEAGDDPIKKADLISSIVESISLIPEEIERSVYIHKCSEMLKVSESLIQNEVNKQRYKLREDRKKRKEEENRRNNEAVNNNVSNNSDITSSQNNTDNNSDTNQIQTNIEKKERSKFEGLEQLIIRHIIRFGFHQFHPVNENGEQDKTNIIKYIITQLKIDSIEFQSPLYYNMLKLAEQHADDESDDVSMSKIFLNSPDVAISQEAVNLISDKYEITENNNIPSEEKMTCVEYVIHLLLDYKYAIIDDKLQNILQQLTKPEVISDVNKAKDLLQQQILLQNIKRSLGKLLGDRII
ncbi:MAG: DNA primase [Bacteroidaceae bacterium]|nr:DNA primase [Bacteroidaceae bacterium]